MRGDDTSSLLRISNRRPFNIHFREGLTSSIGKPSIREGIVSRIRNATWARQRQTIFDSLEESVKEVKRARKEAGFVNIFGRDKHNSYNFVRSIYDMEREEQK